MGIFPRGQRANAKDVEKLLRGELKSRQDKELVSPKSMDPKEAELRETTTSRKKSLLFEDQIRTLIKKFLINKHQ
jgi:hypothetical protein